MFQHYYQTTSSEHSLKTIVELTDNFSLKLEFCVRISIFRGQLKVIYILLKDHNGVLVVTYLGVGGSE